MYDKVEWTSIIYYNESINLDWLRENRGIVNWDELTECGLHDKFIDEMRS